MYTTSFRYLRASSLEQASSVLAELGQEANALAGGQSLIPLMKLRLSRPATLVDLNFIDGLSGIGEHRGKLSVGAMARHADIENSPLVRRIPILHDCAAGIADIQVRNRGTIGGSLAEADPTGDWLPVLLTLNCQLECSGPRGRRTLPLAEFVKDAFLTDLGPGELLRSIVVEIPSRQSAGAYIAFKRAAPVYASASVAVQLEMADGDSCRNARVYLGCVGLLPLHAREAERALEGKTVSAREIDAAAEAAMAAAEPSSDMRGSADYKRVLIRALTKRAIAAALRRAKGETVEVSHEYVGRN